jgi:hypothetical protein
MTATDREEARHAEEVAFTAAFRAAVEQARGMRLEQDGLRPRGIVIPAGGARMFTCAWVAVRMLRDFLKTNLPIQIWHIGPREMSPAMLALMAEQQVETIDALALVGPEEGELELGGFELKSLALLRCEFREVILLDADNVPLIDPEELFEHEAFRGTGAMFWPDLLSLSASSRIWELCSVAYREMPSFESGQLVIDRARHFAAIALSWFLNRHSRIVYRHIYGDKDSFMMAWLALEEPFHLVSHAAQRLYGGVCQRHPDGRRMFQHRCLRKWRLHGENPVIEGFQEEETCLRYLQELRSAWTGRVFSPPPYDSEMQELECQLVKQRLFRLETVSIGVELVELLPGNLMRRRAPQPACWWLSREGESIVIFVGEDWAINRRFERQAAGCWRSLARNTREQDHVLTFEDDPTSLVSRGHNTASVFSTFSGWQGNYVSVRATKGEGS